MLINEDEPETEGRRGKRILDGKKAEKIEEILPIEIVESGFIRNTVSDIARKNVL